MASVLSFGAIIVKKNGDWYWHRIGNLRKENFNKSYCV